MKKLLMLLALLSCGDLHASGKVTNETENQYEVLTTTPFIFIRHGEVDAKAKKELGPIVVPLNETGKEQAREVAEILKRHGIKKIVSSNLTRALQTAEIIHDALGIKEPIVIVPGLAERNWGPNKSNGEERFDPDYKPEGGEMLAAFRHRVMDALLQVINKDEDGVLIVAHGGVYRTIMNFIGYQDKFFVENAAPILYTPAKNPEQWKVEAIEK